jgi:hypothetical protein
MSDTVQKKRDQLVDDFTRDVADAQAVLYVAIVKKPNEDAVFSTGGLKLLGPSPNDLAMAIGALVGELAENVAMLVSASGKRVTHENAVEVIMPALRKQALQWKPKGGRRRSEEPPTGPPEKGSGFVPGTGLS